MSDETDFREHRAHDIPGIDDTADLADRDVRIAASEGDDEPVSPPEEMPRASERVMAGLGDGETIDERLAQELPDPGTAYGAAAEVLRPRPSGDVLPDDLADEEADEAVADAVTTLGGAPEEEGMLLAGREEPLP